MSQIEIHETAEKIDQPRDFFQFKSHVEELGSGKYQLNESSHKTLEDFWIHRDEFIRSIRDQQLHILFDTDAFDEYCRIRNTRFTHNMIKGFGIVLIFIGVLVFIASLFIKMYIFVGPAMAIIGIAINRFGQHKKSKFFVNLSQSLQENAEDDFSLIGFYYLLGILGFRSSFGTTIGKMYPSHAINGESDDLS